MKKSIYIIAEIGNTHEGSIGLAKCFIKAAADSGADAVKMQTHIFNSESLPNAPNPSYFTNETRKEYFERTAFSAKQWKELKRYAEKKIKIDFFSSPFSIEAVDLLESVNVQIYKIPSGEVNNTPLLIKVAQTKKRVFLSSGMSNWKELDTAVKTLKKNGCKELTLFQCTSEYPCPLDQVGLNIFDEFKSRYKNIKIGFSDHTTGIAASIAAIVKGAMVVEKHFTLSKKMYGSDAKNSLNPKEFKKFVREIRDAETALNSKINKDKKAKSLSHMKKIFEKSIVSATAMEKNEKITFKKLAFKKPGDGILAGDFQKILNKKLKKNIKKNYKFNWRDFK